jgi:hypothetical protein
MSIFSNSISFRTRSVSKNQRLRNAPSLETVADLVRTSQLHSVDLKSLKSNDQRDSDDHFVKQYVRYLGGKILGARTRADIGSIVPGFFRRESSGASEYVFEAPEEKYVELEAHDIRRGFRPHLLLYRGVFGDSNNRLVCSDDLVVYAAYRQLGIVKVPAMILGKQRDLLIESAICTRTNPSDGIARFESTCAVLPTAYNSILGDRFESGSIDTLAALTSLKEAAIFACEKIKLFHTNEAAGDTGFIHYHHTLYSVAYRLAEGIAAIKLLVENEVTLQIRPLVRSIYELFLNFYIDWLCPEQMGPLLQALAIIRQAPDDQPGLQELTESVREIYKGLVEICGNASAKGTLSPLGTHFHNIAYPVLSQIIHQDFRVTHEYISSLEEGTPKQLGRAELKPLVQWLDVIVTATVMRIADDVGASVMPLK